MAAPFKQGLDSKVEVDATMFDDYRFKLLRKYSCYALEFLVYVQILINKNSYFVVNDDDTRRSIKEKLDISDEILDGLIQKSCEISWFDKDVFTDNNVLTSREIQTKWYFKLKRRKLIVLNKKLLLIRQDDIETEPYHSKIEYVDDFLNPRSEPNIIKAKIDDLMAKKAQDNQVKGLTSSELKSFISIPYSERNEIFKSLHNQKWYEHYVKFSTNIIQKFTPILKSNYQITMEDYYDVVQDGMTPEIIDDILTAICGNPIDEETKMKFKFLSYVKGKMPKAKPKPIGIVKKEVILSDSTKR